MDVPVFHNSQKKTFFNWGEEYLVEFDINIKRYLPTSIQWVNVFHFSNGNNVGGRGNRIPGMWINKRKFLHFISTVNREPQHRYDFLNFELNKNYHIIIQQTKDKESKKTTYEIWINGELKHSALNHTPEKYDVITLYLSDEWYPSFGDFGEVSNFRAVNLK